MEPPRKKDTSREEWLKKRSKCSRIRGVMRVIFDCVLCHSENLSECQVDWAQSDLINDFEQKKSAATYPFKHRFVCSQVASVAFSKELLFLQRKTEVPTGSLITLRTPNILCTLIHVLWSHSIKYLFLYLKVFLKSFSRQVQCKCFQALWNTYLNKILVLVEVVNALLCSYIMECAFNCEEC